MSYQIYCQCEYSHICQSATSYVEDLIGVVLTCTSTDASVPTIPTLEALVEDLVERRLSEIVFCMSVIWQ